VKVSFKAKKERKRHIEEEEEKGEER